LQGDHGWPTIASFEVEYRSPYWLAPKIYAGNHLSSYGSNLTFLVNWIVMRGDTSGKPTSEPDVVLIVRNLSPLFHRLLLNFKWDMPFFKNIYPNTIEDIY
jgi:hypothetical protein